MMFSVQKWFLIVSTAACHNPPMNNVSLKRTKQGNFGAALNHQAIKQPRT